MATRREVASDMKEARAQEIALLLMRGLLDDQGVEDFMTSLKLVAVKLGLSHAEVADFYIFVGNSRIKKGQLVSA